MRTDIVTGGAGFLGYHLVRRLLARARERGEDFRVLVVDDLSSWGSTERWFGLLAQVRQGEVQPAAMSAANAWEKELTPQSVIWHLASPASPRGYKLDPLKTLRCGGAMTDALLSVANRTGARLVFASSSEVYGDPDPSVDGGHPQREDYRGRVSCDGPRSCYDEAKRYGEALCAAGRSQGIDARVVRIFNTYGPNLYAQDGRLVASLLYAGLTGTSFHLRGSGEQTRSLSYVDDTIAGILAVEEAPVDPGATNVGGAEEVSLERLIGMVEDIIGREIGILLEPQEDEHDPQRRCPDLTRLRGLGWEPTVSTIQGLTRTAEWMNGPGSIVHG